MTDEMRGKRNIMFHNVEAEGLTDIRRSIHIKFASLQGSA
jgi:hypothetical protein